MRHTIILSDVHLWDALPGDGLWMRYRQRRFFPDAELASMLDRVVEGIGRNDALTVVFNGDVFDFDVAPVYGDDVVFSAAPHTPALARERLSRILDDHPLFLEAVARVLAAGHEVVFVSGNHDAQMAFAEVRSLLADRVLDAYEALGPSPDLDPVAARARLVFRSWFHRTVDGIHVEHGNQYDRYCSFRYPMEPFTADGAGMQPTVGSLAVRHMVGRMGYFNPNVDSTFTLSLPAYLKHWARYYLFTPRSLARTWATGAMRIALDVVRHAERGNAAREARHLARAHDETGASADALQAHTRLFAPVDVAPVARLLCLDRLALVALGAASIGVFLASRWAGAAIGLVTVGAVAAFNIAVGDAELSNVYVSIDQAGREIRRVHGARAVVFGHTHKPLGTWEDGAFQGNCGSWSPQFRDVECTVPVDSSRPFVWLRSDAQGALSGGLYGFADGAIVPVSVRADEPVEPSPRDVDEPREQRLSVVA